MAHDVFVPTKKVGVDDRFAETGTQKDLFDKYGLSAPHIVDAVKSVVARKAGQKVSV